MLKSKLGTDVYENIFLCGFRWSILKLCLTKHPLRIRAIVLVITGKNDIEINNQIKKWQLFDKNYCEKLIYTQHTWKPMAMIVISRCFLWLSFLFIIFCFQWSSYNITSIFICALKLCEKNFYRLFRNKNLRVPFLNHRCNLSIVTLFKIQDLTAGICNIPNVITHFT